MEIVKGCMGRASSENIKGVHEAKTMEMLGQFSISIVLALAFVV